jgi:hypothetical protein
MAMRAVGKSGSRKQIFLENFLTIRIQLISVRVGDLRLRRQYA